MRLQLLGSTLMPLVSKVNGIRGCGPLMICKFRLCRPFIRECLNKEGLLVQTLRQIIEGLTNKNIVSLKCWSSKFEILQLTKIFCNANLGCGYFLAVNLLLCV